MVVVLAELELGSDGPSDVMSDKSLSIGRGGGGSFVTRGAGEEEEEGASRGRMPRAVRGIG
eukprot:3522142-Rhodomonas_salina.2